MLNIAGGYLPIVLKWILNGHFELLLPGITYYNTYKNLISQTRQMVVFVDSIKFFFCFYINVTFSL